MLILKDKMLFNVQIEKELKNLHDIDTNLYNIPNVIGIRLPSLRKYAKSLSKKYSLDYLLLNISENYHDEVLLKGMLIGLYNLSFNELKNYLTYYLPKINTWDLCDSFVSSLKITKKYLKDIYLLLEVYLKSSEEYIVRFALVMLLNYYLNDEYIDKIYTNISSVSIDKYYVKMANAWLISYCLVKYYDKTYIFLKNNNILDKWTHNKSILYDIILVSELFLWIDIKK